MHKTIWQLHPVPFTNVTINDHFWSIRLESNRERSIPHIYKKLEETGRLAAYKLDWVPGMENPPHQFWDSDVAKWIEAASYSLATHPDSTLEAKVDEVIALIASAQQAGGYLNPHFTVVEPQRRWKDLRNGHELYCAGHLIEAGVAHFQATGKRTLLNILCRYADYIDSLFGTQPGKKRGYCGHEEIELALVKLYHATGEQRYLQLSRYFIDERGRQPNYFDLEGSAVIGGKEYHQAHLPVREQNEVVGHAVRAMYLYSAMADLAAETGDESLFEACQRLWQHLCSKRMFITGGIGSSMHNEGFTSDYDLPNHNAYAETCAAIGLVLWSHRMLQIECNARYADVMERVLYNGVLSGVSLDGTTFFYVNPLASNGTMKREEWFSCACCPPNIARLLASLGQYVYSQNDTEAVVHLYIQGTGRLQIGGQQVILKQGTNYPWDGKITITVELEHSSFITLKLRKPGWCPKATIQLNSERIAVAEQNGYFIIEREWHNGDKVELDLTMHAQRIYAHPDIAQDKGLVALQRGPIIYCLEEASNIERGFASSPTINQGATIPLHHVFLPKDAALTAHQENEMLGGIVTLSASAYVAETQDWGDTLYRPFEAEMKPISVTAIPYYAWCNQQPGKMYVWLYQV
jgi:DUF1680 family protein